MPEYQQELPEEVGVETLTIVAFSDGRPSEIITASTEDALVLHGTMNSLGMQAARTFIGALSVGVAEWRRDGTSG